MLGRLYSQALSNLDRSMTYLFEIIFPENRIVVDYGKREELILLAIIDTKTGKEFPPKDVGFPIVKRYDGIKDLKDLQALEEDNREGFVVRFKSGYRLKIKFAEYLRIHKLITKVSSIVVWEYLRTGQSMTELLESSLRNPTIRSSGDWYVQRSNNHPNFH